MRILTVSTALAALVAAGCASPTLLGWTRPTGETRYAPTDPAAVRVLEAKPAGGELLGQVHGVYRNGSALEAARVRAADLGADAIVILAVGDEESEWIQDPFPIRFIEANAWRTAR